MSDLNIPLNRADNAVKQSLPGEFFSNQTYLECGVKPLDPGCCEMLIRSGVRHFEIEILNTVSLDKRNHCIDAVRRWAKHGDTIITAYSDVIENPYIKGDTRKIGPDRISRISWERFPEFPVENSFASFDLRAFWFVRPDLRSRIDLNSPESETENTISSSALFHGGWLPSQLVRKGSSNGNS